MKEGSDSSLLSSFHASDSKKIGGKFESIGVSTVSMVADRGIEKTGDVAPPLHLSTTFENGPYNEGLVYSRADQMTRRRVEKILGILESGGIDDSNSAKAQLYSSGVASVQALLHALKPKRIAVTKGYGGTMSVMHHHKELTDMQILSMEDEMSSESSTLEKGDVYFVETPSNPRCILFDVSEIARRAKEFGIWLVVDSTFASPILQNPLELGADLVMHSCTKFMGGHSDLLGGVLITKNVAIYAKLVSEHKLGFYHGESGILAVIEEFEDFETEDS